MFVAHDVLLDVTFGEARPRLVGLTSSRALVDASRAAYQEGLTSLPGPLQPESVARLARVRFLPPTEHADTVTVGLRWEATGVVVGLFPVLDADITLAAAGEHTTTLTLSGVYRAPCLESRPAVLSAPVPPGPASPLPPGLSDPVSASGLVADAAVRALLRHAARHLTGTVN